MSQLSAEFLEEEIKRTTKDRNWFLVEIYFKLLGKKFEYDDKG